MFRLGFPALLVFVGALFAGLMHYETRPITGHVVDSNGEPVAHAKVQLQKLFGEQMFTDSWRWKDNQFEPVLTREDGSFVIPFPREGGDFRLVVEHKDYALGVEEVDMGEPGVEIQLLNSWTVIGEFLWDTDLIEGAVFANFQPNDFQDLHSSEKNPVLVSSGEPFQLKGLPSGKGIFFCGDLWPDASIFRMELDLPPGGGVHDIGTVDLRGEVKKVSVTVLNEDGEVETGGWAVTLDGKHRDMGRGETLDMFYSGESVSFEIYDHDYRLQSFENVTSDQKVTLQKGIPIEIELESYSWFPEDLWVDINLILLREGLNGDDPPRTFYTSSIWDLPAPGEYKVMIALQDIDKFTRGHGVPMTYVTTEAEAPIITVLDQEEVQIFQLETDENAVRDAVRRLRYLEWPKD